MPGDDKDDWKCECGGVNYANRQQCYKCKADRPGRSSDSHSSHRHDSDRHDDRHHHSDHHRDSDYRSDHHSEHRSSRDDSYNSHSDRRDRDNNNSNSNNNNSYRSSNPYGSSSPYSSSSSSSEIHQCDGHCPPSCPNNRIYISGLNASITEDEVVNFFSQIGVVARRKIKGKFKDEWPYQVYLYQNKDGTNKGDAALTYEDPATAHQAVSFFNGNELKGSKIEVSMATMKAAPPSYIYC